MYTLLEPLVISNSTPVIITKDDTTKLLSSSSTHTVDATGNTVNVSVRVAGGTEFRSVFDLTNNLDNIYAAGVVAIKFSVPTGSATIVVNGI